MVEVVWSPLNNTVLNDAVSDGRGSVERMP